MNAKLNFIQNIDLIHNNLDHAYYELTKSAPSYFRIAVEVHNVLLRSMVEVLKGTANSFVVRGLMNRTKQMYFTIGSGPQIMIQKEKVENCNHAWRFSKPETVGEIENHSNDKRFEGSSNDYLVGFYDLLAMIQCDYFMEYFSQTTTIIINDEDLHTLDWLHEMIRNRYEHFVPKSYGAPIIDLIESSLLCLEICTKLLVEPTFIHAMHDDEKIKEEINNISVKLRERLPEKDN